MSIGNRLYMAFLIGVTLYFEGYGTAVAEIGIVLITEFILWKRGDGDDDDDDHDDGISIPVEEPA